MDGVRSFGAVEQPSLDLIEAPGAFIARLDPQHRRHESESLEFCRCMSEQLTAEPMTPVVWMQVDRIELATCGIVAVALGSVSGEACDPTVDGDDIALARPVGLDTSSPHVGALLGSESIEVVVRHHVAVRGLPRSDVDFPDRRRVGDRHRPDLDLHRRGT